MLRKLFLSLAMFMLVFTPISTGADDLGDTLEALGSVLSINDTELVIMEFDFDNETEKRMTYLITDETLFQNFEAISEVGIGNDVYVLYTLENGRRIVYSLSLDRYEDEYQDDNYEYEQNEFHDDMEHNQE